MSNIEETIRKYITILVATIRQKLYEDVNVFDFVEYLCYATDDEIEEAINKLVKAYEENPAEQDVYDLETINKMVTLFEERNKTFISSEGAAE